jgi:hypothetical protein
MFSLFATAAVAKATHRATMATKVVTLVMSAVANSWAMAHGADGAVMQAACVIAGCSVPALIALATFTLGRAVRAWRSRGGFRAAPIFPPQKERDMITTRQPQNPPMPLRMQVVWDVLEGAKDAGDQTVVVACNRLIEANRTGWRKHHDPADWQMVKAFAE